MIVRFYNFWNGFYQDPNINVRQMLMELIRDLPIPRDRREVHIYSVFVENPRPGGIDPTAFNICWSGEPFINDPAKYDLNLIMRADDPAARIVYLPLFAFESHTSNYWPLYMRPRPFNPAAQTRFCAFVYGNDRPQLRKDFFARLCAYKRADACGTVLNNCNGFQVPRDQKTYFAFLSQFKFSICFENSSHGGWYITEKLHNAWLGGTIPIYWGCTNAPVWLNPDAFLMLEDESEAAMDRLIARIAELDNDPIKYEAMYRQPLIRDGLIPEVMRIEVIKAKMRNIVSKII